MERGIAIISHVDDGMLALEMAIREMKSQGLDIVNHAQTSKEPELILPIRAFDIPELPVMYAEPIKQQSTMNQRKRRKLGRQNPHSKYAK